MKNIMLTGDRPTGRLHIGHYVGSLKQRVALQSDSKNNKLLIMIADAQALTDNYGNPQKVRENVIEVILDYLSVGVDPTKTTIFIQSEVRALPELTAYYMNLVKLPRLLRNPTVKNELKARNFDKDEGIPVGFANYPISQAADITAFDANIVPVGEDQLPMIEQAREIVKSFNLIYGDVLTMPEAVIPSDKVCRRLPGIDGNAKMSKSLNNGIYLADDEKTLYSKVMKMYTDPNHINISDKGSIKGNIVFTYLEVFATDDDFNNYLPKYKNLADLKKKYQNGGVGDVEIKKFLYTILNNFLSPIRDKRHYYEKHIPEVLDMVKKGTEYANTLADETLLKVKSAMGINYFNDDNFVKEQINKYKD